MMNEPAPVSRSMARFRLVSFTAVMAAIIAIGVLSRPSDTSGTPPLLNVVGNAGRVIAFQFPESATERRERIIVAFYALRAPAAIRVPADTERERGPLIELSDQQWIALQRLRESWCRSPPVVPPSDLVDPLSGSYTRSVRMLPSQLLNRSSR